MNDPHNPDETDPKELPNPAEIQKELENLMKDKFGGKVKIIASQIGPESWPSQNNSQEESQDDSSEGTSFELNFEFRPKEVTSYLDKYIIKQNDAKKALAIAVCDHYNHVRNYHEKIKNGNIPEDDYAKQNILMLGPTGVGKTYLVKCLAKLIGVPFLKADATRFTEVGYVGANVEDMVRDLVSMAGGNVQLAQYGIIYLDEADKLAGNGQSFGRDISGRGVQHGLLKLMEETEIDLKSATDMIGQLQAFMDFQKNGKITKKVINTRHILFIVSGAFNGLDEIIRKRLKVRTIGLSDSRSKLELNEDDLFKSVSTLDLVEYGLEPEFVGRLPIRPSCHHLNTNDLFDILKNSKGSILNQYKQSFKAFGIDIYFKDCALNRIAELAYEEKTGARALMTVCERIFRDFKYELPSCDIKAFCVTKELVNSPNEELLKMLKDKDYAIFPVFSLLVENEMDLFFQKEKVNITFTLTAMKSLYAQAKNKGQDVPSLIKDITDSFIYGIKLLQQKTGSSDFCFDESAIENPELFLETLIKNNLSHRQG